MLSFSLLRPARWLVAVTAALMFLSVSSAQQLSPLTISGVLNIVHGDSISGAYERIYTLTADDGTDHLLTFAPEALAEQDILRLYRRHVEISISPVRGLDDGIVAASITPSSARDYNDPPVGAISWINLPCRLNGNSATPRSPSQINAMFANEEQYVDHFYRETSHGIISLNASTRPWRDLARSAGSYQSQFPVLSDRLNAVFDDCVAAHNGDVTFAAGMGINILFNDNGLFSNFAYGGSRYRTLDGVSESFRVTWLPPFGYANCHNSYCGGTILPAHEMGHALGMPHSNNSDGDGDAYDNPWDLMSDMYEQGFTAGPISYFPFTSNTYHYDLVGWVNPADKFTYSGSGADITIDHWGVGSTSNYFMAVVPLGGGKSLVVETRKQSAGGYQARLPGSGVLIYKVKNGQSQQTPAQLLRAKSDGASGASAALQPGQSYSNAGAGVTITVLNATADGYQVRISGGAEATLSADTSINEGDNFSLDINLSETSLQDVTLTFAVTPLDGLRPGDDYTVASNKVVIPAGSSSGTLTVHTVDDLFHESPEQFTVSLVKISDSTVTAQKQEFTVSVTDNDPELLPEPVWLNSNATFEGPAGRGLNPAPWTIKKASGDKFTCKGKGHQGSDCAMQFVGNSGEASKLKGTFTLSNYALGGLNTAVLRAAVLVKGAPLASLKLKAKVKFIDGVSQVITLQTPAVGTAWALIESEPVALTGGSVESVKLIASFKGTTGKLFLDDFALEVLDPGLRGTEGGTGAALPPPAAPEGWRGR